MRLYVPADVVTSPDYIVFCFFKNAGSIDLLQTAKAASRIVDWDAGAYQFFAHDPNADDQVCRELGDNVESSCVP